MTPEERVAAAHVSIRFEQYHEVLYDNPVTKLREIWRDGALRGTYDPASPGQESTSTFGTYDPAKRTGFNFR